MENKKSRIWRFVFVLHLYAFVAFLAFLVFIASSGLLIWKIPEVRRLVHNEVVRLYLGKVAPHLPFTLENIDADADWNGFLKGEIKNFSVTLIWSGWTFELAGPIQVHYEYEKGEAGKHIRGTFKPIVLIEPPADPNGKTAQVPPVPIVLTFLADADFSHMDELGIQTDLKSWDWDEIHLKLKSFSLTSQWNEGLAQVDFSAEQASFSNSGHEFTFSGLKFKSTTPLKFRPLALGPRIDFGISSDRFESLAEGKRIELALKRFPLEGKAQISNAENEISVIAGNPKSPDLDLETHVTRKNGVGKKISARWKVKAFSLRDALSTYLSAEGGENLHSFNKISGTVETKGSLSTPLPLSVDKLGQVEIDALIRAQNVAFEWPENYFAASGINLNLPISTHSGLRATVSAKKILFRRVTAKLDPTEIFAWPSDPDFKHFEIHIGSARNNIPLKVSGLPVKIGNIDGTVTLSEKKDEKPSYEIGSSFRLDDTDISSLMENFCVKAEHVPPAKIAVDFSNIELNPDSIDPTGHIRTSLFDGVIDVDGIAAYALSTEVPEYDFNLNMNGVKLAKLGDWSGFGEMDGVLKGYAHKVVLQAMLPTQYDVKVQVSPLSYPRVAFSPDAMKNVAKLVASNSIESLPGIAQWMAFGGVTRFLLGDFGVWFAGLELFSHDGSILVETLSGSDIPADLADEQKQNHYVLYGRRFKIPLATPHYPVVVDAPAVSNALHRMAEQIISLRNKNNAKDVKKDAAKQMDCAPPTL